MSVEYPVFNFQEDAPYELIRCSICNGQLKDPRMLPCLHTFCLDCLEDYVNVDCQGSGYQEGDCDNFEHLKSQTAVGSNGGTFFSSIMSRVSGSFVPSGPTIMEVEPKDKEEFPCPICRKRVTIPADGLSKLPINVFLEKFLQIQEAADKKDDSKVPANSVTCEVCQNLKIQGSGSSVATRFCVDCNQHLCQRCVEYHRLLNTTNSHKLVSLGSQLELLHRLDDVFCRFHKSEKLEVYCRTCGTGECRICFASQEHLGHSGCGIVEAEVDLKRKLIEGVEDLCSDLETVERNLKEVAEISDRFNTGIDNVENGVQNKEDEMKEVLMRHAMKLKRDIDDRKRSFNRELERVKDCLEKHKVRVEQSTKYTNLVLRKASSAILVCSAREICKRLAELRKMSVPELACELEPIFTPSKLATEVVLGRRMSVCGGVGAGTIRNKICSSGDTVGTEENLIGFLEFKTKFSRRTSVVVTMTKSPVVLQSLPCTDYAIAMALISDDENDFLCCATYSSDDVLVCDATAFDKKKASTSNTSSSTLASSASSSSAPSFFCKADTLKVAGLKNAFSMTVVENHLFVTEWKSDMVHKIEVVVDIGVDNEVASTSYDRWSLGTGEGLNCLSNTKDNRFLLVTCPEVASLTIVDVNGHLKRKIPLDFSIDKPSESLQLNDDDGKDSMFVVQQNETSAATAQDPFERYVVSHSGNNLDRVCLIDGTGKMLATYGTLKGGPGNTGRHNYNANYHMKQQQLNGPYRMATDLVNNLVFVSDHYNHRIILLSSIDLKPIRELITPTFGLSFPLDLLFDTKRQLLHVADLDNKRFVTFTFQ